MEKEINQKIKYLRIFSIIILFLGAILMMYMVKVESEPGALPLLMILIGIVGLIFHQMKIKNQIDKI